MIVRAGTARQRAALRSPALAGGSALAAGYRELANEGIDHPDPWRGSRGALREPGSADNCPMVVATVR